MMPNTLGCPWQPPTRHSRAPTSTQGHPGVISLTGPLRHLWASAAAGPLARNALSGRVLFSALGCPEACVCTPAQVSQLTEPPVAAPSTAPAVPTSRLEAAFYRDIKMNPRVSPHIILLQLTEGADAFSSVSSISVDPRRACRLRAVC